MKDSRPLLLKQGIDLQYFAHYINTRPSFHSVDIVLLSVILSGSGKHLVDEDVYDETGISVGVTHYGQRHTIVTGPEGMEIMNMVPGFKQMCLARSSGTARYRAADIDSFTSSSG